MTDQPAGIRSIDPHYAKRTLYTKEEAAKRLYWIIEQEGGIEPFCEKHQLSQSFVYRSLRSGSFQGKLLKITNLRKVNLYEFTPPETSTEQERYRAVRKHHREVIAPAMMEQLEAERATNANRDTY